MLSQSVRRLRRELPEAVANAQRAISTSAPLEQAAPALATAAKKTGGFFSSFFGASSPALPPLDEPLPGVPEPPPFNATAAPPGTKITTLDNGMRIASEDIPGAANSVGVYIASGSVYEDSYNSGVSHLLERMVFKSTINRTHFRLVRELEAIGGNIVAGAHREVFVLAGDSVKTYLPEVVEILADSVRNPRFAPWEVAEQLEKVREDVHVANQRPEHLLLEALHQAGYQGSLGRPLLAPESGISRLTPDVLHRFVESHWVAPNLVLSAAGADHDELLAVAEPLFGDMARVSAQTPPPSKYVGGDWRRAIDSPLTHVALAFEFEGGWRNVKGATALSVLQVLLGGGGSFSAGGPGKGMYSRLYTGVLSQYSWVTSATAFSHVYNDTGMFGIHISGDSYRAGDLVNIATDALLAIPAGKFTQTELDRAKRATISSILMNLESRTVVNEDIGKQILTYGKRLPAPDFLKEIEALTMKDIQNLATKMLKTPPTVAAWGDVVHVPRLDQVASRFG
ncbi:mitochondrial processing peptidase alpha subunit [Klebsormidium nitens]|uniref:Alpha-MPP n=1 Tax=Klebsormidium nitens TaxID=105231 RepID=A0A1Y1IG70_KLENI|nr:mitochondrial processing peptidase alpha subunit [Klebsormidium nitens]|eukprot:GAQ89643.1 mitochondrial processing peptidase alpha subunit [Klebsormidium nitens]